MWRKDRFELFCLCQTHVPFTIVEELLRLMQALGAQFANWHQARNLVLYDRDILVLTTVETKDPYLRSRWIGNRNDIAEQAGIGT
jgi:hypothetical protein